jgi:hypothetical protein
MELFRWLSVSELLVVREPVPSRVGGFQGELESLERIVVNDPLPMVRWYPEEMVRLSTREAESWESIVTEVCKGAETCPLWVDANPEYLVSDKSFHQPSTDQAPEIQIISTNAEGLELRLTSPRRGWLYLNIFQDEEWVADMSNSMGQVHTLRPFRANQIGQSIPIDKGVWAIRLYYGQAQLPSWVTLGASAILMVTGLRLRKNPKNRPLGLV